MKNIINCSIGVCIYNEEKSIEFFLDSLLRQKLKKIRINKIFIISSGSTDGTNTIIKKYLKKNKRIVFFKEKKRKGKSSAVNFFLQNAREEILVLASGDLILAEDVIEKLILKFANSEIGMTGAHPIPNNNIDDGFCGFAAHLLWDLHHRISLLHPKMGEVIAFRRIFERIPLTSGADEASIEPLIRGQGYKISYVPDAKIYNKAPSNIQDYIKQRRRNYCLHLTVKYEQSYIVSTLNSKFVFRALFSFLHDNAKPKFFLFSLLVVLLEVYSRFLGWWDYAVGKKRHIIWEPIKSTKNIVFHNVALESKAN